MSILQKTVNWLVLCCENVVYVFLFPEVENDLEQQIAELNTNGETEVALGLPPPKHNSRHLFEIICMNIKHAVMFVYLSSNSGKTTKWAQGPARPYLPHRQPEEALRCLVVTNVYFFLYVNLLLTAALCLHAELQNLLEAKKSEINSKIEELERSATNHTQSECVWCIRYFSLSSRELTEQKKKNTCRFQKAGQTALPAVSVVTDLIKALLSFVTSWVKFQKNFEKLTNSTSVPNSDPECSVLAVCRLLTELFFFHGFNAKLAFLKHSLHMVYFQF